MSLTLKEALHIAETKEGYVPCRRKDHGYGKLITYNGKTAPAKFVICPLVQFYPKPSFQFHSVKDFLKSSTEVFTKRGWWNEKQT